MGEAVGLCPMMCLLQVALSRLSVYVSVSWSFSLIPGLRLSGCLLSLCLFLSPFLPSPFSPSPHPIPPSSYSLLPSFPFTAESVYPKLIFL